MEDNKVVNIEDGISIGLTEDELRGLIPIFAGFIDLGRRSKNFDVSSDELAKDWVEWAIYKFNKEENEPKEGKILKFENNNKK